MKKVVSGYFEEYYTDNNIAMMMIDVLDDKQHCIYPDIQSRKKR